MNEVILRHWKIRVIIDLELGRLQKPLAPPTSIAEFQSHGAQQTEFVQHRERAGTLSVWILRRSVSEIDNVGVANFFELVQRQHIGFDPPEKQFTVRCSKEWTHFSEYRVDDRFGRRIDRISDSLRRTLPRLDFHDFSADEHQVARPVQRVSQEIIKDALWPRNESMVYRFIGFSDQAKHGIGVVGIDKALVCRDIDIFQKDLL